VAESDRRDAAREGSPLDQAAGAAPAEHPVDPASLDQGYEVADASGRALAWVMLVGAAVIAASIGGLFVLVAHYHREDASHPPLTAEQRAKITPPGPHLQAEPFRDIAALRRRETALLQGFAYLDADHKRARIPIDRAIALVIGKPLDSSP
jgi:hypothetical protein